MKTFLSQLLRQLGRFGEVLLARATRVRRAFLRSDARERREAEADRLDRLRNPQDYKGK